MYVFLLHARSLPFSRLQKTINYIPSLRQSVYLIRLTQPGVACFLFPLTSLVVHGPIVEGCHGYDPILNCPMSYTDFKPLTLEYILSLGRIVGTCCLWMAMTRMHSIQFHFYCRASYLTKIV